MAFSGGSGSVETPYLLSTEADINEISTDDAYMSANFKIQNNIHMTTDNFSPIKGSLVWEFTGKIDGDGYSILNLKRNPSEHTGGFIETLGVGGVVENLSFEDASVTGSMNIQGIVCGNNKGTIQDVEVYGNVSAGNNAGMVCGRSEGNLYRIKAGGSVSGGDNVGGLIGEKTSSGVIEECYTYGSVEGTNKVGGLVGEASSTSTGVIDDCYSLASVSGNNEVGGLVGRSYGIVRRCFAAGPVEGNTYVGGLEGIKSLGATCYTEDSFYDVQATGQHLSGGGTGRTTKAMRIRGNYTNWNFIGVWGIFSTFNQGYPFLRTLFDFELPDVVVGPPPEADVSVVVYDKNINLIGQLENAFRVGYGLRFNEVGSASFSLPADDPKNALCQPFHFVELWEGTNRVDMFRILPSKSVKSSSTKRVEYECEHVLGTLLDDVLFRVHELINKKTEEVLDYILSQQVTEIWKLGVCEFNNRFWYNFENENLLSCLFSVPDPIPEDYMWTWDTTRFPFVINLVRTSNAVLHEMRYRKNLKEVTKVSDPSNLFTRIYPLGHGEGVNQLDITNVNPTGYPYIDADTQDLYGVISRVWVDRRFTNEESLYNTALKSLQESKTPRYSYDVKSVDLNALFKRVIRLENSPELLATGVLTDFEQTVNGIKATANNAYKYTESLPLYHLGDIKSSFFSWNVDCPDPGNLEIAVSFDGGSNYSVISESGGIPFPANPAHNTGYFKIRIKAPINTEIIELLYYFSDAITEDDVKVGTMVRIIDEDDEVVIARVISKEKKDIIKDIGDMKVEVATVPRSLEDYLSEISEKVSTGEKYTQGTTNIISQSYTGTYSNVNPLYVKFRIPYEAIRINFCNISYKIDGATSVTIKVDGNTLTGTQPLEIDDKGILTDLEQDPETGIVLRGFHDLEVIPNQSCTIDLTLDFQIFVRFVGE